MILMIFCMYDPQKATMKSNGWVGVIWSQKMTFAWDERDFLSFVITKRISFIYIYIYKFISLRLFIFLPSVPIAFCFLNFSSFHHPFPYSLFPSPLSKHMPPKPFSPPFKVLILHLLSWSRLPTLPTHDT